MGFPGRCPLAHMNGTIVKRCKKLPSSAASIPTLHMWLYSWLKADTWQRRCNGRRRKRCILQTRFRKKEETIKEVKQVKRGEDDARKKPDDVGKLRVEASRKAEACPVILWNLSASSRHAPGPEPTPAVATLVARCRSLSSLMLW